MALLGNRTDSFDIEALLNLTRSGNFSFDFRDFQSEQPTSFSKLIAGLNLYAIPIIIMVGVAGNTLSFYVFLGTYLSRQSSSIYLAYLSVADTGFLLSLFLVWLEWVDIKLFHKQGWCQLILYTTYLFSYLSVWTVVAFTAER